MRNGLVNMKTTFNFILTLLRMRPTESIMKTNINYGRIAALALPCFCWGLVAATTACGDDAGGSGTNEPEAGVGGADEGKGGTAGPTNGGKTGDTGGKSGDGGSAGKGTAGTEPQSGAGGETPVGPTAGAGGETMNNGGAGGDGTGPVAYHPAKLNGANGTLVPGVHDLRGLTYSASGKIWASGYVGQFTGYPGGVDRQVAVVRFDADGTLDTTFDGDGIKTFNLRTRQGLDDKITNDGDEYSMGLVELPTGDLVIQANVRDGGGKGRDVVLFKMSQYGQLINFSAGPASTPPSASVRKIDFGWTDAESLAYPGVETGAQPVDESWGIALSPDATKVVVFGYGPAPVGAMTTGDAPVQRTDNDRYVVSVNVSNGVVDAAFNGGKPYSFNSGGTNSDGGRRGSVEADGSIVSAGYTNIDGFNMIHVLRLSATGVPDATFTQGTIPGVFVSNPFFVDGGLAECYAAKRQSTGRYVTTGYGRATKANTASTFDPPWLTTDGVDMVSFGFKQTAEGGKLDTTYGVAGTLAVQSEGLNMGATEDRGRDLVVLPDDRVVFAGRLGTSPALFVTTADGALDSTEGGLRAGASGGDTIPGAYLYAPLSGTTSHFFAISLSADKKRVAATTGGHADGAILAILDVQ
jgi:uncharacterized delta-60 repeat protein